MVEEQQNNTNKDIRKATPDKGVADLVLDMITKHNTYLHQAHTGFPEGIAMLELNQRQRRFESVEALTLLVAVQREMIIYTKPFLKYKSDKKEDYDTLQDKLDFLNYCIKNLRLATWSKTVKDDFIVEKDNPNTLDKEYYLTENFYDMLEDLEGCYEVIFDIMLRNGLINETIINSGRKSKTNEIW